MTQSTRVWRQGPPPHIGWWNTIDPTKMPNEWRWWNGENWGIAVRGSYGADDSFAQRAYEPSAFHRDVIQWSDYWPADARVPRLDPTDGHWTFNSGVQPVPEGTRVEVAFRGGETDASFAHVLYWGLAGASWDIIAWRPAVDTAVNSLHNSLTSTPNRAKATP